MRFGKSKNMNERKRSYDTAAKNRSHVIKQIPVKDIRYDRKCVFFLMEDYKVRTNSSFFECTYNQLIDTVADCVKFFENRNNDKTSDIHKNIGREKTNEDFDRNEIFLVKIEFDDDDDNVDNLQIGGSLEDTILKYISYRLKYLELNISFLN